MDILIHPTKLRGNVSAIPSKSQAHRLMICAAFSDAPTTLLCSQTNRDMDATAACLQALGAEIKKTERGYHITPIQTFPVSAHLNCWESGSTLRFLLPIVGALGINTVFHMEGRLPDRPLSPLWEEMERMGCCLTRPTSNTIHCQGKLKAGIYTIAGNISSQFITGLLLALVLLNEDSKIIITGKLESKPYVDLTIEAMKKFQVHATPEQITGGQVSHSPDTLSVEGDWSNSAFFLAANSLGNTIAVDNLDPNSSQGDRAVKVLLPQLKENCTISASHIPDLIPILSVVAAANSGAVFTDIQRLRLKESDRVETTISMLEALGGKAEADDHTMTVYGTGLSGGTVNAANDHRIAMSAAIAATICSKDVLLLGAECVQKSYPDFWEIYSLLGGNYEQYIR